MSYPYPYPSMSIDFYLEREFSTLYKKIMSKSPHNVSSKEVLYKITNCPYLEDLTSDDIIIEWFREQKIKNPKVEDLWLL